MMPSLSGFDVLAHVKKLHPTRLYCDKRVCHGGKLHRAMKKGPSTLSQALLAEQLRVLTRKAIEYTRTMQDIAEEKSGCGAHQRLTDGSWPPTAKRGGPRQPAFLRMLGCQEVQVVGRSAAEVFRCEELDQMIARLWTSTRTNWWS